MATDRLSTLDSRNMISRSMITIRTH